MAPTAGQSTAPQSTSAAIAKTACSGVMNGSSCRYLGTRKPRSVSTPASQMACQGGAVGLPTRNSTPSPARKIAFIPMRSNWGDGYRQCSAANCADMVTDSLVPGGAATKGSSGDNDTGIEPSTGVELGLDPTSESRH